MDWYHRLWFFFSNRQIMAPHTADEIWEETLDPTEYEVEEVQHRWFGVWDSQIFHLSTQHLNLFHQLMRWLPLQDQPAHFPAPIQPIEWFSRPHLLGLASTQQQAEEEHQYSHREQLRRLVTTGIAAHLLERNHQSGYQVDLRYLSRYGVRQGFLPYGARLLLDDDLQPTTIELGFRWEDGEIELSLPHTRWDLTVEAAAHDVKVTGQQAEDDNTKEDESENEEIEIVPIVVDETDDSDDEWLLGFRVFFASVLLHVTLVDKVLGNQLQTVGNITSWLVLNQTNFPTQNLASVLHPFFFRVPETNSDLLSFWLPSGGLLPRIFGLTQRSFDQLCQEALEHHHPFVFTPQTPQVHDDQTVIKDGHEIWKIINKFSQRLLEGLIKDAPLDCFHHLVLGIRKTVPTLYRGDWDTLDNLIHIITTGIFSATFWNQHLSDVGRHLLTGRIGRFRITKGMETEEYDTIQTQLQGWHLVLLQHLHRMPHLTSNLWVKQSSKHHGTWQQLQRDLKGLKLNTTRLQVEQLPCTLE